MNLKERFGIFIEEKLDRGNGKYNGLTMENLCREYKQYFQNEDLLIDNFAHDEFSNYEKLKEEIQERIIGISNKDKKRDAEFFLEDALDTIKQYEFQIKNTLDQLKFSILDGDIRCTGDIYVHFPIDFSDYERRIKQAKEAGADVSGLPTQLNYLERLN